MNLRQTVHVVVFDKRTHDWIKCKNMKDDDFVVCGYIPKENHMTSLVLGQYIGGQLICRGHVTLGVGGESFRQIKALPRMEAAPLAYSGEESVHWVSVPGLAFSVVVIGRNELKRIAKMNET